MIIVVIDYLLHLLLCYLALIDKLGFQLPQYLRDLIQLRNFVNNHRLLYIYLLKRRTFLQSSKMLTLSYGLVGFIIFVIEIQYFILCYQGMLGGRLHVNCSFFGGREGLKHYELLLLILVNFSHRAAEVIIIDIIFNLFFVKLFLVVFVKHHRGGASI